MRNIYSRFTVAILILAMGFIACTSPARKGDSRSQRDPRTSAEGKYNVFSDSQDKEVITSDVPEAKELDASQEQLQLPKQTKPSKQTDQHFSVQVFATKSSVEAKDFKASIDSLFKEEVRIDYQAPYYRVCIGKISGFENGEDLLKKVNAMGFPKAWLVRDRK